MGMKKAPQHKNTQNSLWSAARGICLLAAVTVNVLCLLVWMEAICQNSYSMAIIWLLERTPFALLSGALLMLLAYALIFLLGRAAPAVCLLNLFMWLMATVNRFKLNLRGDPLQFSDLGVANEAFDVTRTMFKSGISFTEPMYTGFFLMVVLAPLAFYGIRVMRGKPLRRLACAAISCALCVPCLQSMAKTERGAIFIFQDDYCRRGFCIAFVDTLPCFDERRNNLQKPESYSRDAVMAALAPAAEKGVDPDVLPDILFVMSESLFDIADQFELTEEPMPYFKHLQQEFCGGEFMTPSYGGGTVNVEYEVLTGYRASDTSGYSFNVLGDTIRENMNSVVSLLKNRGYYAEAMHPNVGTFYDRQNAYKMMGFDRMHFSEDLDPVPQSVLYYPPDDYLFNQIIRAYENRPADRPWFCHTVTYQNHTSYIFDADFTAVGVNNTLAENHATSIHNYVNMLRLSDEALRDLIAYFQKQERPIVVVIWGDHAPAINQFGLSMPSGSEALMRYYTTPYLVWNNYGADFSMIPKKLSSYRLGASVLNALGLGDTYFRYLSLPQTIDLTLFSGLTAQNGELIYDPALYEQEHMKLLLLHYDRLLGENYGEKDL